MEPLTQPELDLLERYAMEWSLLELLAEQKAPWVDAETKQVMTGDILYLWNALQSAARRFSIDLSSQWSYSGIFECQGPLSYLIDFLRSYKEAEELYRMANEKHTKKNRRAAGGNARRCL